MDEMILRGVEIPAIEKRDYAVNLVQYCTANGLLSEAQQTALRAAFENAAAERIEAYTKGRSASVTRQQAEAIYASILAQLDAVLLRFGDDARAAEALRTQPPEKLLNAGLQQMLTLYEEAKAAFRRAYPLTAPVQTAFFRGLLEGFAAFTTQYDARFNAADAAAYIDHSYPLLGDRRHEITGLPAVHAYYRALETEAEIISAFPAADVQTMMRRYAEKFLTAPQNIAENIAELIVRHWLTGLLTAAPENTILLPADAADALTAQFAGRSQDDLEKAMRDAIAAQTLLPQAALRAYLCDAVPTLAGMFFSRIEKHSLRGWLA